MARKVARDVGVAGEGRVKRCYGIVGDALNPVIDALRRHREDRVHPLKETAVRVSYTDIEPPVDALEQLLFDRTESGRAPSDPDPLDFVTARALSSLIHHPDFIVALLRACSR